MASFDTQNYINGECLACQVNPPDAFPVLLLQAADILISVCISRSMHLETSHLGDTCVL